jgi:hypothetical protein
MKRWLPLLLLVPMMHLHAQSEPKDTVKVGLYVVSIFDIDYPHQSFSADFWVWFLYASDSLDPTKTMEVSNAKTSVYESIDTEKKKGLNWGTLKCKAVIKQPWDARDFPFDQQNLKIVLEDAQADTTELVYIADTVNSHLSSKLQMEGWNIGKLRLVQEPVSYETNYGNPELTAGSTYPGVVAYIDLQRNALGLFFKLFTGVYIAFAICMILFFINASQFEARLSLAVGAMFAIVANKYVVDSQLPATSRFTLVDQIHAVSFLFIFFNIIASVISMELFRRDTARYEALGVTDMNVSLKRSQRADRISFAILLVAYLIINGFYIIRAV